MRAKSKQLRHAFDPARPLEERRGVLSRLDLSRATRIQVSPAYDDGAALLSGVVEQGLAGVVAKRRGSAYRTDGPTGDWIRVAAGRRVRRRGDEPLPDVDAIGRAAARTPEGLF